ncbi:MAG: hypothetical protein K1X78_08590 [Verrucomicrobiaceae bacterium]|nr:hypothetical protein [Verrucomicrobiaceae bacterium]
MMLLPAAVRRLLFSCALTALASSCSSSKKDEQEPEGATVSGLDRFQDKGFDRKTGKYSADVRSQYDQKNFSSSTELNQRKFSTGIFSGKHDFEGSSRYKAGEYSQSGKVSREAGSTWSGATKTPREASKDYTTKDYAAKESRYSGQQARQGDKTFAGSDETFRTRAVWDAEKSQKQNKKPTILPKEDSTGKSVYSEADVARMLNRN